MVINVEETKRNKAKNLRYRKAIAKDINFEKIQEELYDIYEECTNVQYYLDSDDDTLLNALDGDSEEEFEFKMMFSALTYDCEQMVSDMQCEYVPQYFDDFFVAVGKGESFLGWDSYEGDYFGLGDSWEENYAREEARKRISRLTKEQIIDTAQICFKIFKAYIGIRHRYDCLKSAMDILKDGNTGYLQTIKQLEKAYERADADGWSDMCESVREFEKLVDQMPDMAWIQ